MNRNEELAYVAGLFDGEGCFKIDKVNHPGMRLGYHLHPEITLINTDEGMVRYCQEILGVGKVYNHVKANEKHKTRFDYRVGNLEHIMQVIDILKPFLRTRLVRADLLYRFARSRFEKTKHQRLANILNPYTEEELEIARRLQSLNRRGPPPGP